MGLLQRGPAQTSGLFNFSNEAPKLIIGLGNVGDKYDKTRHNAGFMAVDHFAQKHSLTFNEKSKFFSFVAEGEVNSQKIILAKPTTFMNESARAVLALQSFYKTSENDLLVVHDEVDIDLGCLRSKMGGGSAGHNGIKSVSGAVGEDFARIRVGIKGEYEADDTSNYVLSKFPKSDLEKLGSVFDKTDEMILGFIETRFEETTKWCLE